MENSMSKFYYQVYYPEMSDNYITDTVEIETSKDISAEQFSNAIDQAMNRIENETHDDRIEKASAILNVACEILGGSWHYLNITGVLEVNVDCEGEQEDDPIPVCPKCGWDMDDIGNDDPDLICPHCGYRYEE
jgi:DNA-directed RNA polymerase subunit RPC12/RpoP